MKTTASSFRESRSTTVIKHISPLPRSPPLPPKASTSLPLVKSSFTAFTPPPPNPLSFHPNSPKKKPKKIAGHKLTETRRRHILLRRALADRQVVPQAELPVTVLAVPRPVLFPIVLGALGASSRRRLVGGVEGGGGGGGERAGEEAVRGGGGGPGVEGDDGAVVEAGAFAEGGGGFGREGRGGLASCLVWGACVARVAGWGAGLTGCGGEGREEGEEGKEGKEEEGRE